MLTVVCIKTIVETILISTHHSWKNILDNSMKTTAANVMGIFSVDIYIFFKIENNAFLRNFPDEICNKTP